MEEIITVRNLEKTFRVYTHHRGLLGAFRNLVSREHRLVRAVDGINFSLLPGEMVGYLGPNGAGKSTTLKMLTGLLQPSGGEVRINGCIPWRDRQIYVRSIGAVFGQRVTLWWDLPVIESFDLLQHIYGVPPARYRRNLKAFRDLLDLDPFLHTPVRSLSLGQRMRADLCAALLHDPTLLFLDEPTIGLDVVAKERIREFLRYINKNKATTIILTTHDLLDVEKLCERVMIIDQGKLLFDGKLAGLTDRFGGQRSLAVEFNEEYDRPLVEGATLALLDGRRATYTFEKDTVSASDLIVRLSERYRIRDLSVKEPAIEDTIRRIYEQRLLDVPTPGHLTGD